MTAERESKIRSWFSSKSDSQQNPANANGLALVNQAIAPKVITKKAGDVVKVSIDITDMQVSDYVGFRLNYPVDVIAPVIVSGTEAAVKVTDGDIFGGHEVDIICNALHDSDTGEKWMYVSKVIITGDMVAAAFGRIITIDFVCVGSGSGTIEVVEREYGSLAANSEYESESDPLSLTILSDEPVVVIARFKIVVE